jgi:hypothetical protein
MVAPVALAIPIIMAGARVIIKKAPEIAKRLIQQGKAKHPDKVIKDLEKAIAQKSGPGRKAVIKPGGRSVVSGPIKEANKLIKTGEAQSAQTVLNSLKKGTAKATKKAGGGTLKTSKQIMTIRSPRPTIKKPWGAAKKGVGKGYK